MLLAGPVQLFRQLDSASRPTNKYIDLSNADSEEKHVNKVHILLTLLQTDVSKEISSRLSSKVGGTCSTQFPLGYTLPLSLYGQTWSMLIWCQTLEPIKAAPASLVP